MKQLVMSIPVKKLSLQASGKLGAATLYVGDAHRLLPRPLRSHPWKGKVDLAFVDPPFNIGRDYAGDGGASDRKSREAYIQWTKELLSCLVESLRPGGSLFYHIPDEWVSLVDVSARSLGLIRMKWIILHQEFGQYQETNFISSKVHLLYFVKSPLKKRTWNVKEILEPSLRLKIGDKRTAQAKHKGMRPMLDVWYGPHLGRVQGNNEERCKGHDNQLPELYLARILRCASNPKDTVLDPYLGSGTTGVVARALGRNFIGMEIVPKLAKSAFARIKRGPVRDVHAPLRNGEDKTLYVFDVKGKGEKAATQVVRSFRKKLKKR